ncbi:Apoptotic protease-activating factor 1 [Pseudolycoriella hygida]|uniref:Apoptotic protease-activating factor 1 n=1 Tax=Pseudolycoriella hygida TaxID=35572 RepID=A0A9Q0NC05_9DIPT|nr:Apoptotic protease-activating factor 1 [Pseudolycoriella hygida]
MELSEESLFRCEDDFAEDFEFVDIQMEAITTILFTELECSTILSHSTRREQVKKMFHILIDAKKNLRVFIDVLSEKYDWLGAKLQREIDREDQSIEVKKYRALVETLRSELPKHSDLNVKRAKHLFELEQKLLDLKPHQYVVVHGNLGYGKRYLSLDACCNFSVVKRMDFQIFWLNVSKCNSPETVFAKLHKLYLLLQNKSFNTALSFDNYDNTNSKIFKLKQHLRDILSENYKNCLLVLIDVLNLLTLKSFDLHCKILMTTRNKELLERLPSKTTKAVQLSQGFNSEESLGLFVKVLGIAYRDLPAEAAEIHRLCKGNPFLISLIAGNMKEYPNKPNRWIKWKNIVENTRPTDTEYHKLIKQSLMDLSHEDGHMFRSLVIFPNDVNIPASLLQLYWGKSEREVEEIIKKFDKLYLVDKGIMNVSNNDVLACSLQYHYYSYLQNIVPQDEKTKMHLELLNCYKILDAINERTEPNIVPIPDDGYFYYYIGYHIKEANRSEVFPKIFRDFGFLEQKLRATGLPNTIGDLESYRQLITGGILGQEHYLNELLQFLKGSEEVICKSEDTCLLQYAITTVGDVHKEAVKQSQQFTDRVWFDGNDHLSKHRQIVKLPKKPYLMKFFGPDAALVAFDDIHTHTIVLTDLSLWYTVEPTQYQGHTSKIIDLQIFLRDYFLSLDESGVLKVWSLKNTPNERRRSNGNSARVGARQNHTEVLGISNINAGTCCQTITSEDKIVSLYLTHRELVNEIGLYVAFKNGRIKMYEWRMPTCFTETLIDFDTKIQQIKTMICPYPYLIVLNQKGNISFFNLKYSSEVRPTAKLETYTYPLNVYDLMANDATSNYVVVVYHNKIVQIKYAKYGSVLHTEYNELYSTVEDQNKITCSSVSDDSKYLILGTQKGIIVFDPIRKTEKLRSSVSDNITSLDICGLDNDVYKYILISGSASDDRVINISGLNFESEVMQWASDRMGSPNNENNLCSQRLDTWLLGGKLFYVSDMNKEVIELLAIDSRAEIHKRTSGTKFMQSEFVFTSTNSTITVMSAIDEKYYLGYANGFVFELDNPQPFITLGSSVEYLKCFTPNLIVASTKTKLKIRNGQDELEACSSLVVNSFETNGHLIIVKNDCSFEIYGVEQNKVVYSSDTSTEIYGGCDFAIDCLIIGTKTPILHIWRIKSEPMQAEIHKELRIYNKAQITSVKLTQAREYFAVGCSNGAIELYNFSGARYLNTLQSNQTQINDMVFSPWTSASTLPIILATISDQICFWNISYVVNNPIENGALRRSQRFDRKASMRTIIEKMQEMKPNNGNGRVVETNLWTGKLGPTEKPELLAAIQFNGSSADQIFTNNEFTKFVTIDDEGEIYYLKIRNNDSNGNI